METKRDEVIKWLKIFERLSSSRFVGLLGFNYDKVKKLLDELKEEGILIEEKETTTTYWRLKNA